MGMKYIGGGFVPPIPARDLSDAEVEEFGGVHELLKTGLYVSDVQELPAEEPKKPAAKTAKAKDGE